MENKIPFTAIGIDYGTRSIGVAVGQSLTGTATALTAMRYNETKKSSAVMFDNLLKIINEWKPKIIVVGWPLNMDGSESGFCAEVKKFSQQLAHKTSVPIEFVDERLTSYEAKSALKQHAGFKEKPVDDLAAKILLESWFNNRS